MAIKTAIVQKFKMADLVKDLETTQERIVSVTVDNMKYVGEECIKEARLKGSYEDITGNLRSSIGYVVLRAGRIVYQAKSQAFKGKKGDGTKGVEEGQQLLKRLVGEYPMGIVLIVVAGMEYAVYVEDLRHRNVLASSQLLAEKLVPELLEKIGLKKKKI